MKTSHVCPMSVAASAEICSFRAKLSLLPHVRRGCSFVGWTPADRHTCWRARHSGTGSQRLGAILSRTRTSSLRLPGGEQGLAGEPLLLGSQEEMALRRCHLPPSISARLVTAKSRDPAAEERSGLGLSNQLPPLLRTTLFNSWGFPLLSTSLRGPRKLCRKLVTR